MILVPADGSSQSDNDFVLGANDVIFSDDPTFTGTIDDHSAYLEMDGGDYLGIASGINTAFLRDMHKTSGGSDFWVMITAQIPDDGTTNRGIFSTGDAVNPGITIYKSMAGESLMSQFGTSTHVDAVGATIPTTPALIIVSHSHSTDTTRIWVNSATATSIPHVFDTTTDDAIIPATIDDLADNVLVAGTRVYGYAYGNAYLNDTDALNIITHMNVRHNRIYA